MRTIEIPGWLGFFILPLLLLILELQRRRAVKRFRKTFTLHSKVVLIDDNPVTIVWAEPREHPFDDSVLCTECAHDEVDRERERRK